jgi:hypothetical protein
MKIEHWLTEWHVLIGHYENGGIADVNRYEVPHNCDVLNCPGAVNKRKLEAFEEILEALEECCKDSFTASDGMASRCPAATRYWKAVNAIAKAKAAKEPHGNG